MNFNPQTTADLIADIIAANSAGGSNTITLRAGYTYVLNTINNTDANGANGLPQVTCNLVITCNLAANGQGATITRASTAPAFRLLNIQSGASLSLINLTLTNGKSYGSAYGGAAAVLNNGNGSLSLTRCVLSGHNSSGTIDSFGGAITSYGTLSVDQCYFANNQANFGGAIDVDAGTTSTILNTIFQHNVANTSGGAVAAGREGSTMTITSCQFINNTSGGGGGAIRLGNNSQMTITKSTFTGNQASGSNGSATIECVFSGSPSTVSVNTCFFYQNTGLGSVFNDGRNNAMNATNNWWGASDGPGGAAGGSGEGISSNIYYLPYLISNNPIHTCDAGCLAYQNSDGQTTPNPISLHYGEKREDITDLTLTTPAEPLVFTRYYRQAQQSNTAFQFMGLGWTHSQAAQLALTGTMPNRTATLNLLSGTLVLNENPAQPGAFMAAAGSTTTLLYSSTSHTYTLTTQDQKGYVFDETSLKLLSRSWPNGEVWMYTYASAQLTRIDDGYGRQLNFAYISNPGGFNDGQLWRVGDQTAAGLNTGTPTGRYVELSYQPERQNGLTVTNPRALLTSVQDVLGNVWTYNYYGQQVGQSDVTQLNFMTQRLTPSVDTTGDGTPDGALTLESLTYTTTGTTINQIVQQRGLQGANPALLTNTLAFYSNGHNTTETTVGKTTTHHFESGIYNGTQTPLGNYAAQTINTQFRPGAQIDARGNSTQLAWSTDAKFLNQVTDALNNTTAFTYTASNALATSADARGRTTQYLYNNASFPQSPTDIKVLDTDGITVLHWQKFTYDTPKGRVITEQTVSPADGTTVQQQVTRSYYASGTGAGLLQTLTQQDLITPANTFTTTYFYDSAGRVVQTNKSLTFGSCDSAYTVYDASGNVVASICNYNPGMNPNPTTAAQAVALFNSATPDINKVTAYEYDTVGRRVKTTTDAGASYALITLTVYDALNRVIRTISNYVADGSIPNPYTVAQSAFNHGMQNNQNLVSDTVYNLRGSVRQQIDVLGNVLLYGYDNDGRLIKTVQNASQTTYNNDYTQGGDPTLASYGQGGASDQDIINTNQYDAAGNLVQTVEFFFGLINATLTGYDVLNRPVRVIRHASNPTYNITADPTLANYFPVSAPDQDLIDFTEYNAVGEVQRTQDALGNWILYGYDGLGHQVKVVRNASSPTYNIINDPALSNYPANNAADQDIITLTTYDNFGRVLYPTDVLGNNTWSAYDGLNRVIKTIGNAVGMATDGSANDPRSPAYVPSTAPDRDLISQTLYDTNGNVQWTQDVLGRKTWYVYDSVGRQIKLIQNCTYISGSPQPSDDTYVGQHTTDSSLDAITKTIYDVQGRVSQTIDVRSNVSRFTYDVLGRRIMTVINYVTGTFNSAIPDQDIVQTTTYDLGGRVIQTLDNAGRQTRFSYDALGRLTMTIQNYQTGVYNPTYPDQDLISTTVYDKRGWVLRTTDARGTQTTFTYDRAKRRLTTTQAAGTPLATVNYTCYDKGGRVLRTIQNWIQDVTRSPDAKNILGNWAFAPTQHGVNNDQNLISQTTLDALGRSISMTDPMGHVTNMTYNKSGQLIATTDMLSVAAQYRYDLANRRLTTVQSYQSNSEDPALWVWSVAHTRWEQSNGTAIAFGSQQDTNVIVQTTYDKAGRQLTLREPHGNLTNYAYDALNRRTSLTNPLSQQWATAYADVTGGKQQIVLTDSLTHQTQQTLDRLGRLQQLQYLSETPKVTPDITFGYDALGNRLSMSESVGGAMPTHVTGYLYDQASRLQQANFDTNGDGTVDQTVSYQYDAGGLKTQLTLPGNLTVTYTYDARGRLTQLTDWASQATTYTYDNVSRPLVAQRANGLYSRYDYDPAGRLHRLSHVSPSQTVAEFTYALDARGNRTATVERLPNVGAWTTVLDKDNAAVSYLRGTWTDVAPFKVSSNISALLSVTFTSDYLTLTVGTGPDHGLADIYIDHSLWQSVDSYAASPGEKPIPISLIGGGTHLLELRNRADRNQQSSGSTLRFKSVTLYTYTMQNWQYVYDALARLTTANLSTGTNPTLPPTAAYTYAYDVAGNRTSQMVTAGSTTTTLYVYDAANRLQTSQVNGGIPVAASYDSAGNLLNDGTHSYAWDRANRLLSLGSSSYAYNGLGRRVQQTISGIITQYMIDAQPGLVKVLQATTGANTTKYIHGPMGIHEQQNTDASWHWMVQDGLGSVREVVDNTAAPQETRLYSPFGELTQTSGSSQSVFGFTGEETDSNGLVNLRARYYNPTIGQFMGRDPIEGTAGQPMSLNRYGYAMENVVNWVDPSGLSCENMDVLLSPEGTALNLDRQYQCQKLKNKLEAFEIPTWDEVFACYQCTGMAGDESVESYNQAMAQALQDKLASSTAIERAKTSYSKNYHTPLGYLKYLSTPLSNSIDGYVEGVSLGGSIATGAADTGIEMVYNLATFQRASFWYSGAGFSVTPFVPIGVLGTYYAGYIRGFAPIKPCTLQNVYDKFLGQYAGHAEVASGGGAIVVGEGVNLSFSHTNDGNVNSDVFFSAAGLGVGGAKMDVYYRRLGRNEKYYMNSYDGKVDAVQLKNDIESGTDSIIKPSDPDHYDWVAGRRHDAAALAYNKAILYNSTTAKPCSC